MKTRTSRSCARFRAVFAKQSVKIRRGNHINLPHNSPWLKNARITRILKIPPTVLETQQNDDLRLGRHRGRDSHARRAHPPLRHEAGPAHCGSGDVLPIDESDGRLPAVRQVDDELGAHHLDLFVDGLCRLRHDDEVRPSSRFPSHEAAQQARHPASALLHDRDGHRLGRHRLSRRPVRRHRSDARGSDDPRGFPSRHGRRRDHLLDAPELLVSGLHRQHLRRQARQHSRDGHGHVRRPDDADPLGALHRLRDDRLPALQGLPQGGLRLDGRASWRRHPEEAPRPA